MRKRRGKGSKRIKMHYMYIYVLISHDECNPCVPQHVIIKRLKIKKQKKSTLCQALYCVLVNITETKRAKTIVVTELIFL